MIAVDRSCPPLVIVRVNDILVSEDVRVFEGVTDEVVAKKQRFLLLFDAIHMKSIGARDLKRLAQNVGRYKAELASLCVAEACIMSSSLIRGAFKAFVWLQPLPFPFDVFADYDAAFDYLEAIGARSGVPLPPRARELRVR